MVQLSVLVICGLKARYREADRFRLGFHPARQKSFPLPRRLPANYEEDLGKLGKHKTGKGYVYIRKLADVVRKVLEKMIRQTAKAARSL
ncbi:MAG TPA: hypothetical protein VL098_10960 [Flavipsychrobacter sp.]|nr:hypothetical protein [Flavipsychrobacter sp.]